MNAKENDIYIKDASCYQSEKNGSVPIAALLKSMDNLSISGLIPPDLLQKPAEEVNPELVTFLDGDGNKGYAVDYEKIERSEPGTVIEMEWEKKDLQEWIERVIDERQLDPKNKKDLVLLEIGTAPALGSFEALWKPLEDRMSSLSRNKITVITSDISLGMAGLGADTLHKSNLEQQLQDKGLDTHLYAVHADGFKVIENLQDNSVTVISAPFGVLGFGLGNRTLEETIALCSKKLELGGLLSLNGYTKDWLRYTNQLKKILTDHVSPEMTDMIYRAIVPFIIDIYEDSQGRSMMSVGDGKGFPCDTHDPQMIRDIYVRHDFKTVDVAITPQEYCFIPKVILAQNIGQTSHHIDDAMTDGREYIQKLMETISGGKEVAEQIIQLQEKIKESKTAPYYTVKGRKS